MKGLTADEYRHLEIVEVSNANPSYEIVTGYDAGSVAEGLHRQGYVVFATLPGCICGRCEGFALTARGRLAMTCYRFVHSAVVP